MKYKELLAGLKAHKAIGSAIIGRDGNIISTDMPEDANLENFAIMMATLLGAAITAASEIKITRPSTISAESKDSSIMVHSIGGKSFIAVVLPKDRNVPDILEKCEEILRKLD
jgi:predicted regulator of Ras-like GTPase activity (Roadblock/LC7/MglB family)